MGDGKIFWAVIGDLKKSRELQDRNAVQKRIREILDDINKKYSEDIASKFLLTLGDEFQGLLRSGDHILAMITEIKMRLHPVRIRFGIGAGEITTDINPEMALGADGPGYYYAREAIDRLKEKEHKKKAVRADIYVKMKVQKEKEEILVNTVFELMSSVEDGWTDRQRQMMWDMLRHRDGLQKTADRLGITQSTVQKALTAGNYYTYENAMESVERVLAGETG